MKKWFILPILVSVLAFAACRAGSGSNSGKDTVTNRYGSANDTSGSAKSTIDTSKATSHDNSASGGANLLKDTAKKKDAIKK